MLTAILEFAFAGFVYGFVVRPWIQAAEQHKALNDLIASYGESGMIDE